MVDGLLWPPMLIMGPLSYLQTLSKAVAKPHPLPYKMQKGSKPRNRLPSRFLRHLQVHQAAATILFTELKAPFILWVALRAQI